MMLGTGNRKREDNNLLPFLFSSWITFSGGASWVDVRDVARIAVSLMGKNVFGERFCIVSENIPFKEISSIVRKMAGLPEPTVFAKTTLKVLSYLQPVLKIMDKRLNCLSEENIEWFCTRNYYSGRKVRRRLAFRFHSVRDSLEFHYRNYQSCRSQKTADGESKILRRIRRLTGRFSV